MSSHSRNVASSCTVCTDCDDTFGYDDCHVEDMAWIPYMATGSCGMCIWLFSGCDVVYVVDQKRCSRSWASVGKGCMEAIRLVVVIYHGCCSNVLDE